MVVTKSITTQMRDKWVNEEGILLAQAEVPSPHPEHAAQITSLPSVCGESDFLFYFQCVTG